MDILLINPDYMLYANPPLGLAYLGAYIRKKGFKVDILDQLNEEEILKNIKETRPKIIGITAVSENYYRVKNLGEKIKKISDSLLIIGGVHITTSPDSFENSPFDLAIKGEGEITFSKIADLVKKNKLDKKNLKKIKGIIFRDKEKIVDTGFGEQIENLDSLPMPARDLMDMEYYNLPTILSGDDFDTIGSIITSRGCPYNCKFCSSSCFWGRRIRFFSAKRVVEEIKELYFKYKYKKIFIYDDLFTINKKRLKEIVNLLEKERLLGKIKFYVYGRADVFDEEIAKMLKKMNVITIDFGLESGSDKTLHYLKGGIISVKDNENAVRLAKKYDFIVGGFFMIGSPYETIDDMDKTYEFIKKNCKENFIIYQTIPFPGTAIWDYALKEKIIEKDYYDKKRKEFIDIDKSILLTKEVSKKEFEEMYNKIKELYTNTNKNLLLKKIFKLRPKHIISFLSPKFRKKALILRKQFIKRVFS